MTTNPIPTFTSDLASASPVEVDTFLADLSDEQARTRQALSQAADAVKGLAGAKYSLKERGYTGMSLDDALVVVTAEGFKAPLSMSGWDVPGYIAKVTEGRERLAAIADEFARINAEYRRRPWSRFFKVVDGHIHSSMDCSTCNNGRQATLFGWLPTLSGLTEADAVAEHGALLCTVCFPSAPVEWTNFYEEQEAAKKAAQCPGSLTYDYDRETARLGYYTGNSATCNHCGGRITVTKSNKMRGHKPA